jgi:prepilin-type N-terminal cleavage/methylation domain-containing protein
MNSIRTARRAAGFTLIELITTLVVLGILIALAAPKMSGWINHTRVESTMNGLMGDINYARMLAVRSGHAVTVTIKTLEYPVATNKGRAKRVNLATEHPGVALAPNNMTLQFNSRGLLNGANAVPEITATKAGQSASLQVLPTGRAYREY